MKISSKDADRDSQHKQPKRKPSGYEALLQVERRVFELILSNTPLSKLLETIVLGIEEITQDAKASVLLLDKDGIHIRLGASPHLPPIYTETLEGMEIGPAQACSGSAMFLKKRVIIPDVSKHSSWEEYTDIAKQYNLKSCWSTPVFDSHQKVIAAFALYYEHLYEPTARDFELIDHASYLVKICIELHEKTNALQTSESRFRHAFQDAATGIAITDLNGYFLQVNAAYCQMLGYSEQELYQKTFMDITHPDDRDISWELTRSLFTTETGHTFEKRYLTKNGQIIWVRLSISAPRDETGQPINLIAVCEDITQKKLMVAELEEKQSFLRMASQISRVGAWSVKLPECSFIWSEEAQSMHEVPTCFHPSLANLIALYPKEYQQWLDDAFKQCMQQGTPFHLEIPILTSRKNHLWIKIMGEAVRDETDTIIKVQGAFQDITEQKRLEEIRQETEHRFRQLTENIQEVFWLTNATHDQILYVSPAYEQIWGRSCQELYEHPRQWLDAIFEEDRSKVLELIQKASEGYNEEYRILRPDGELRWILDRSFNIYDANGQLYRVAGVAKDITERKKTEQSLSESEERFRLLSKATNDAIWDLNLQDNAIWWNEGFETLFGYQRNEISPNISSWMNYIHPEDFNRVIQGVFKVINEGKDHWSAEYRFRRKDGSYAKVFDRGNVIRDERGKAVRMIGGMTDLTERYALEEQLRQSQRLESLGQLTGGVAHDFNNMLTIIMGNAELLAEELSEDASLNEMAVMIYNASQRGAELTKRLLAFARRQALEPRLIDLNVLLENMMSLLKRTIGDNIEIKFKKEAQLWPAMVDPSQLENAILNLCLNARDAMPAGGQLIIETQNTELDESYADMHAEIKPGSYAEILISDTGSGIAPEHLKKVFEPFFSTKSKDKGTGLGLSMVFGFIKQSGGHINIYSEPGNGTTVRLYLPKAAYSAIPEEEKKPQAKLHGHEKVLLVEDNEKVRHYASEQLRAAGYEVTEASNGLSALDILKTRKDLELLFTDIVMEGGLSGTELAALAQKLRPDLKVLYTSGYPEDIVIHQGQLTPGVHLLSKPYRRVDLLTKIREALNSA
ncbi:sensory box/GGDEF family protein [Legionella birminghamensis]|uniref:histidine kinase n=1 Tax=Legionella birminghamensis TaxID=28083 RepID=A0A378I9H3_9GAMM|nr:PAS domain-containing protein [Legionella birminghamensis]KTC68020.1 sensory box/GGDEF family protein [Legionella birminghamensis]STX31271.1 sensory box/GGDEF family protein [Legionella birminghamensis]